jgi:serine/threonine protein kinase/tetratricopeptide (TPR) repeat protein
VPGPADEATFVGRGPADDATSAGHTAVDGATYVGRSPANDATYVGRPQSDDVTFVRPSPADDLPTMASRPVRPPTASRLEGSPSDHLKPGEEFGTRYQIIKLLGVGGMGAVYQAWDAELGVAVAIKTIRPGVGTDASAALDAERRFKRELLLARQVTHPNVVRIYDLGEIDGTKYITMSYVEGQDLATLLAVDGKLPVDRALDIMRQVVAGMRAAHTAGIVHRDLKPANIMIDGSQALIMDFGIARSVTGPADDGRALSAPTPGQTGQTAHTGHTGHRAGTTGVHQATSALTVAGSVMGTLDYMAPEQATGQPVDQRADIYALGLIFYDIILGRAARPKTGNPFADFKQRMAEPLKTPKAIDPAIPDAIDAVIARCLQTDPEARYQSSDELGEALDALDEHGNLKPIPVPVKPRSNGVLAAAGFLMILAAAGSWFLGRQGAIPVEERPPLPVLIANFDNRTGDPVFDGALEQVLKLGVEGASFVTAYPREAAARIARELAPGQSLDEERARLVAVREGLQVVLVGKIEPQDTGYRITVRALDGTTGAETASASADADDKDQVLGAVDEVATDLRRALGDTAAAPVAGLVETFTAGTLEAASAYARAEELMAGGRVNDAIAAYQQALERDPNFGRAYSGWAVATLRAGRPEEAESLWKKALALTDRMTEREKYRTLGSYYLGAGANDDQAIDNYRTLLARYPADGAALNNLAVAYFNTLDFQQAMDQGAKAVEVYPGNLNRRTNLALYAMYAGDFDRAVGEAKRVLETGPFDKAYLPIAVTAIAGGRFDEAAQAYADMAKVSARGASLSSMGLADLAIYRGRTDEARAELARGAAADQAGNQRAPRALKLVTLAEVELAAGARARALALVDEALALSTAENVVIPAARILVATGRLDRAAALADGLEQQVQKRRRAMAGVIRAEIALAQKKPVEAIDALSAARALADSWLVRYTFGRVYVEAARFVEATAELEAAQKRLGEGAAIFLDDWPTFRETAAIPYWLGRAQDGLGLVPAASKNYQSYLDLRGEAKDDALAADARKRMAAK